MQPLAEIAAAMPTAKRWAICSVWHGAVGPLTSGVLRMWFDSTPGSIHGFLLMAFSIASFKCFRLSIRCR